MQVATKFMSIYEIENGLELTGLYFLPGDGSDGYLAKNYLKGNNLITTGIEVILVKLLANYDFENDCWNNEYTSVKNNGSFGYRYWYY